MLKDAALLQLDLNLAALEEDMILKDSSPYNVQFKGAQAGVRGRRAPSSACARASRGSATASSACSTSTRCCCSRVKDFDPRALLRGNIDGITPAQMRGLVSFRDRFRKGFYLNVFLHAKLEAKHGDRGKEVKAEVKKAGFKKELIVANVRRMRKLVAGPGVEPAAGRVGGLRRAQQLHRRRRQAQGRVRPRGGHLPALGPDLGHRLQQRPLLAHRRRGLGPRAVGRLRPGPDRAAAPHACTRRATRRSSRSR